MFAALLRLLTLRRVPAQSFRFVPVVLAALWLFGALALAAAIWLVEGWPYGLVSSFASLATCLLAALVVAGLVGGWDEVPGYAGAFSVLGLVSLAVAQIARLVVPELRGGPAVDIVAGVWAIMCAIRLIAANAAEGQGGRLAAMAAVAALLPLGANLAVFEDALAQALEPPTAPQVVRIDHEALWPAQPRLLEKALASLPRTKTSDPRLFAVTIAAGGRQALFGREATAVRALIAKQAGQSSSALLLSNAAGDANRAPLASRDNIGAALTEIGKRYDPARDIALVYLTAHGGPAAELQTDLADGYTLQPITAGFLADALDKAGIRRRIVIVSACYSGSWIAPLASADTIVLTASSATRTSFGCDDRRTYTFFGEALIGGSLRQGASLRDAFGRLQDDIGAAEAKLGLEPSLPMASIGTNMSAVWNAPLGKR